MLTKDVRAAILLQVIAGGFKHLTSVQIPVPDYINGIDASIQGVKLVFKGIFYQRYKQRCS